LPESAVAPITIEVRGERATVGPGEVYEARIAPEVGD
jgi:hypothetical protein